MTGVREKVTKLKERNKVEIFYIQDVRVNFSL